MRSTTAYFAIASSVVLLAGCASAPTGPSVMALPGTSKNFDQFRNDDAACRVYSRHQTGGSGAGQAVADAGVRGAVVGTVVGAVAGAAIGGRDAAGVGAGTGLLVGSMAGSGAAQRTAYVSQRDYDNAYIQCMYGKGQRVPVTAAQRSQLQSPVERAPVAAGTTYLPPPPPGSAPPGYLAR